MAIDCLDLILPKLFRLSPCLLTIVEPYAFLNLDNSSKSLIFKVLLIMHIIKRCK